MKPKSKHSSLHHLLDVGFKIRADFGTAKMTLQEILDLQQRGLVELDRAPDGFVDLYIDDQKIARGEVLAIGNHYGVRIKEIIDSSLERTQPMTPLRSNTPMGAVHSAPRFEDMLREAEAEDAREQAPQTPQDNSIAGAYEFPDVNDLDPSHEGRYDEPTSGPVDRQSETYSPRRSVPNPRQPTEE